ncbi:pyruvate decarboxylase isozyme 2 [Diutina catenulata]
MSDITTGRYLFERLNQLNVKTIFGVPGDYNLVLLDAVEEVSGMKWAGNANELNAAYAADGYSRVKGLGCVVTTFGVGELSAMNGIAGAYAEHVGVVHVVGIPSIEAQAEELLLHHTLGNGDYTVFKTMSEKISQTSTILKDSNEVPKEIDRCIRDAYIHQRPVYIGLPTNMVEVKVSADRLKTPLDLNLPPNNEDAQEDVLKEIYRMVDGAKNPIILVDACASRHQCRKETDRLAEVTQFPVFSSPMGKSTFDESNPRFGGVYVGELSLPEIKEAVESADLVLSIGALMSDFNTGSFSYKIQTNSVVEFHSNYIKIRSAHYSGVQMKPLLKKLIEGIGEHIKSYSPAKVPEFRLKPENLSPDDKLTQEYLWATVGSWFQEGDIIISETGTSAFGIIQSKFPKNTIGISQVLWGSIGYTVGSFCGAAMASQELEEKRRVILFVGDGSLQLTVQELSTICRWECNNTYTFVLNNDGYTIERLIHGENARYNDIQPWKTSLLLDLFSAKKQETREVKTRKDLDDLFSDDAFAQPEKIRLVEVFLAKMDAPKNLVEQAKLSEKTNSG